MTIDHPAVGNYYLKLRLSFDGHSVERKHFKIIKDSLTANAGRNLLPEAFRKYLIFESKRQISWQIFPVI